MPGPRPGGTFPRGCNGGRRPAIAPTVPRHRRLLSGLLIALSIAAHAPCADAATFLVNSSADTTDGTCSADPTGCTLREAVEAVVATPGRDTIRFDAAVFPKGNFSPVLLTSPLPVIADPAGTVVDGEGTSALITGGNNGIPVGLVFASAPGVPLAKVTVANLTVAGFTGPAIYVCGGELPFCSEDVSGTVVDRVVTNATDGDGIRVEGRNVAKTRILSSVAFHSDSVGIRLAAEASVVGWRIEGCTVRAADEQAIQVAAVGDITGGVIVDTTVVDNRSGIAILSDGQVGKTKISNVVALRNLGIGIWVRGDAGTSGVAISSSTVTANLQGIIVRSAGTNSAPTLTNVVADATFAEGISFEGETSGAKIGRAVALANTTGLSLADNALGASLKDVNTAANGSHGLVLRGSASKLQKVRADGNGDSGILLTPLQNGLTGTSSGNSVQKSVTCANNGHGIQVAVGTTNSRIQKNVALGNGDNDYRDENPDCDANVWSGNVFGSGTPACVQ